MPSSLRQQQGGGASPGSWDSLASSSGAPGSPLSQDMAHWAVRWDTIRMQGLIGRGSFGKVYLGLWNATPVAVKVLIRSGGAAGCWLRQPVPIPAALVAACADRCWPALSLRCLRRRHRLAAEP